ncbi:Hypothetical predicted protein [Pelobates cultripes]|uniref:Uteroglobin n=1 Tax=Pelobates cultripes TaxID=61616 RepID=A0AAD1T6J7_PELCU|nr:Hypothetical predicted protein [Pelobates cultripes]
MKLLAVSVLFALLAVCAAEETFLSSSIDYVKDLASDVSTKASDAINQVKELPLAQTALSFFVFHAKLGLKVGLVRLHLPPGLLHHIQPLYPSNLLIISLYCYIPRPWGQLNDS